MRTEQDVLKDFEKIKYTIIRNDDRELSLKRGGKIIHIIKAPKLYRKYDKRNLTTISFDMQEHELLSELFIIWDWL